MRSRQNHAAKWTNYTANDNAPSRTIAGEGVVQCLHFLASELEHLAFSASAADVLNAAIALQATIDANRHISVTTANAIAPTALAPGG